MQFNRARVVVNFCGGHALHGSSKNLI
jgi:hypothetical protein